MSQIIEAKEQKLGDIFNDAYDFTIPRYQRPYAWTTEQTSALLDDLQTALDTGGNVKIEEMPPYFLGSIVVIKEREKAPSDVIDGQQRLTTLTILFCVLREIIEEELKQKEVNTNTKQEIELKSALDKRVIAQGDTLDGTPDRFRLQLRKRDKEFFSEKVQTKGNLKKFLDESGNEKLPDSRKRIFENAQHLWDELSRLDQSKRQRLAAFLVRRCYLVVVSSSGLDSAYRVFAVMNDRGLNLSATDILKARIIGELSEDNQDRYTQKWEETEEELGRENFGNLFAHIRMIYMKRKQSANLQQEFRDGVLKNLDSDQNFIDDVLVPHSESYQIVVKTGYESVNDADKINRYLEYLRRLDNSDWVPPAIAFFKRHSHKGDFERILQFTRELECLAYALFVRRANINQRIRRYADILRWIEKGDEDTAPLQLKSEEKKEVREILDGDVYNTWFCTPLLLRLDSLLADEGAIYDHKTISVEHVLPQNPSLESDWVMKSFPREEDREKWTHRLANLVLLSRRKNIQAQNYDFKQKKSDYFQKGRVPTFALTSQVLNESDWTTDVLEKRQRTLLEKLAKEWRLD